MDEQDKLQRRIDKSKEGIQRLREKQNDAFEDRNEAEARQTRANMACSQDSTEYDQAFRTFLQTHYEPLYELGQQNNWELPKSIFKLQQQMYTKYRTNIQVLQNAFEDPEPGEWPDARKNHIRHIREWFEDNKRFQPPSCAKDVYDAVLGGPTTEMETDATKRPAENESG